MLRPGVAKSEQFLNLGGIGAILKFEICISKYVSDDINLF